MAEKLATAWLDEKGLAALLEALSARGHRVVGPTQRDGAVVLDDLENLGSLPRGLKDEQRPGHYRLNKRDDNAYFGYVVGPTSARTHLHPAHTELVTLKKRGDSFETRVPPAPEEPFAFLGLRPCEVAAMEVQDRVFLNGPHPDRTYAARRQGAFVVTVNCTEAGENCFCTSMGTGPRAESGFDIGLTECVTDDAHFFIAAAGSDAGQEVLLGLPGRAATRQEQVDALRATTQASRQMKRRLDRKALEKALPEKSNHGHWAKVAERCLACGNCTLVCPTCFCSTTREVPNLENTEVTRMRQWDSCFSAEFSHLHGGPVRTTVDARYRQWLTHKLSTWVEQFGSGGCVGCGRCITWCPPGIDLVAEAQALMEADDGIAEETD
jgi:ferredoxin